MICLPPFFLGRTSKKRKRHSDLTLFVPLLVAASLVGAPPLHAQIESAFLTPDLALQRDKRIQFAQKTLTHQETQLRDLISRRERGETGFRLDNQIALFTTALHSSRAHLLSLTATPVISYADALKKSDTDLKASLNALNLNLPAPHSPEPVPPSPGKVSDEDQARQINSILKRDQARLAASTVSETEELPLRKAIHSEKAMLAATLGGDRSSFSAALNAKPSDLDKVIEIESALVRSKTTSVKGTEKATPCEAPEIAPHPSPKKLIADTLAIQAKEECPKDSIGLLQLIDKRFTSAPKLRENPVIYSSPLVRIELQANALYIFSRDPLGGNSQQTSIPSAMIRLSKLADGTASTDLVGRTAIPLDLKDQSDCILSHLISQNLIPFRTPTDEELKEAARMKEVKGSLFPNDSQTPRITMGEAGKLEGLKFAPMFGSKKSGAKKRLVGTWGLGPCVGVSLWNPETKTAVVAHLDPVQDPKKAIEEMFRKLRATGQKVEARIIGGWSQYSERTLMHVRDSIAQQGARIVQEDTLGFEEKTGARGFIVDADTGTVKYRVTRN